MPQAEATVVFQNLLVSTVGATKLGLGLGAPRQVRAVGSVVGSEGGDCFPWQALEGGANCGEGGMGGVGGWAWTEARNIALRAMWGAPQRLGPRPEKKLLVVLKKSPAETAGAWREAGTGYPPYPPPPTTPARKKGRGFSAFPVLKPSNTPPKVGGLYSLRCLSILKGIF